MDARLRFTGRLTARATRLACQRSQNLDTPQAQSVTKRGVNIAAPAVEYQQSNPWLGSVRDRRSTGSTGVPANARQSRFDTARYGEIRRVGAKLGARISPFRCFHR
jgi:hypothetical protein